MNKKNIGFCLLNIFLLGNISSAAFAASTTTTTTSQGDEYLISSETKIDDSSVTTTNIYGTDITTKETTTTIEHKNENTPTGGESGTSSTSTKTDKSEQVKDVINTESKIEFIELGDEPWDGEYHIYRQFGGKWYNIPTSVHTVLRNYDANTVNTFNEWAKNGYVSWDYASGYVQITEPDYDQSGWRESVRVPGYQYPIHAVVTHYVYPWIGFTKNITPVRNEQRGYWVDHYYWVYENLDTHETFSGTSDTNMPTITTGNDVGKVEIRITPCYKQKLANYDINDSLMTVTWSDGSMSRTRTQSSRDIVNATNWTDWWGANEGFDGKYLNGKINKSETEIWSIEITSNETNRTVTRKETITSPLLDGYTYETGLTQ